MREARDAGEREVLEHIKTHGCHVVQVAAQGALPSFSFSVGIPQTAGAPEVLVMGLRDKLAHYLVNAYYDRVKAEGPLNHNAPYADFLDGFDVVFRPVGKEHYLEHLGWARWFHGGDGFEAVQLIVPSTSGVWPWDPSATQDFLDVQPLLQAGIPCYRERLEEETTAYVCEHVAGEAHPVLQVTHEQGDWFFTCGDDEGDVSGGFKVAHRRHLFEQDPTLERTASLEMNHYLERERVGGVWEKGEVDVSDDED